MSLKKRKYCLISGDRTIRCGQFAVWTIGCKTIRRRTIRRNGIIQSYHCGNQKLKHERADEGAGEGVRMRVSEGEGEGEVKNGSFQFQNHISTLVLKFPCAYLSLTHHCDELSCNELSMRRIVLQQIVLAPLSLYLFTNRHQVHTDYLQRDLLEQSQYKMNFKKLTRRSFR